MRRARRAAAPLLLVLMAVLLPGPGPARAEGRLTLTADPGEARVGHSLLVELEGVALEDEPDLAPLFAEADRVGVTAGTRLSIVTGKLVEIRSWRVLLSPRHAGRLRLGPLKAGDVVSNALAVEVRPGEAWRPGPGDLVGGVEPDPPSPYVQQQVLLHLVLRHRAPLEGLAFDAAALAPLHAVRLSPPSPSPATRPDPAGGWISEETYRLTLPRSGAVAIPAVPFAAVALAPEGGRVAVRGELSGTSLQVRPWPENAAQPWLPARRVALSGAWSSPPAGLHAGDLVTRTIVLEADGVTGADLPEVAVAPTRGLAIVALPTERSTTSGPEGVSARLVRRFEIRALSPTPIFLDTIRVDWWDVVADLPRQAVLPALRFDVAPPDAEQLQRLAGGAGPVDTLRLAAFLLLAFAGAAATLGFAALARRRGPGWPPAWKRSLAQGDAAATYAALLRLPQDERSRPPLVAARRALECELFGPGGEGRFDPAPLRRLRRLPRGAPAVRPDAGLPPL